MPHTPNDSAIKVNKSIEEQIAAATSAEQIKEILRDAAVDQRLVVPDYYDPNVLLATLPQAAPESFTKTVTVNGVSHTISGDSPESLASAEVAFYRRTFAQPAAPTPQQTPARDSQTGRFVEQEIQSEVPTLSAEEKAALQLQFQLGQIDAATYIEESGAVSDYLEKQGVSLPALQEAVQEKQDQKFAGNWAGATSTFIARHPEWPGTEANRQILGKYIVENGLMDGDPLEALEAAYTHARENGVLVENPETAARNRAAELESRISEAQSPSEIREILNYKGGESSGVWGSR